MSKFRKSATVFAVLITSTLIEAATRLAGVVGQDVNLTTTGDLTYEKWGGVQSANVGDYLIFNPAANNDVYTCAGQVMDTTYVEVGPNEYIKTATIDAIEADEDGKVKTLEGESAYSKGDFIVTNPGGDQYFILRDDFLKMYQAV